MSERKQYKEMFDKYIRAIVLPMFPDVLGYYSYITKKKDWEYNGKPVYTYKPYFIIDSREMPDKRRDDIFHVMKTMEKMFHLQDKVRIQYGLADHFDPEVQKYLFK